MLRLARKSHLSVGFRESGFQTVVARASRPCVGCTIRTGGTPVPLGMGEVSTFESQEKQNQIDNEQQHNGRFEDQHQAIGLVVLQQLVKIVQRL